MIHVRFQIDPRGCLDQLSERPRVTFVELDNTLYARDSTWIHHLTVTTQDSGDQFSLPSIDVLDTIQAPHETVTHYVTARVTEPDPFVVPLLAKHEGVPDRVFVLEGHQNVELYIRDWNRFYELEEELKRSYSGFRVQSATQVPNYGYPLGHTKFKRLIRRELSSEQFQALSAAYRMGYFETPQRVTSTEVAQSLGIGQSTFSERIHAAQDCLFELVFEEKMRDVSTTVGE